MYRLWLFLRWCCFSTVSILAPAPALAQPAIPAEEFASGLSKEVAKAAFASSAATRHELAQARRDAIAACFQVRYELYRAGANEPGTGTPVTLRFILEAGAELAEAELALADNPADRPAIRARHGLLTWEAEQITAAQYRAGRVSRAALLQARSARLADEIKLRDMLADDQHAEPLLILPVFPDGENNDPEHAKEQAKAQFEAAQAKTRDLTQARRDALWTCFQDRYDLYRRGANEPGTGNPITLDLLLDVWGELTKAELALSDKPADRLAARADQWFFALEAEHITAAQFRFGRISRAALLQARGARLADEIELRQLLAGAKRDEPFMILPRFLDEESNHPESVKEQARGQFEASQANIRYLALARREALGGVLRIRGELYRVGANEPGTGNPVTLNFLHQAKRQLLEAELALSAKPADRLAACEKDWAWSYLVEEITRGQYRAGRVSPAAYARSRFDRLGAEIRLREAQTRK